MLANLLAHMGFTGPLVRRTILEGSRAGTGWHTTDRHKVVCSNGRCILGALLWRELGIDDPVPHLYHAAKHLRIPQRVASLIIDANDSPHAKYRSFLLNAIAAHQQ